VYLLDALGCFTFNKRIFQPYEKNVGTGLVSAKHELVGTRDLLMRVVSLSKKYLQNFIYNHRLFLLWVCQGECLGRIFLLPAILEELKIPMTNRCAKNRHSCSPEVWEEIEHRFHIA
jgi:hypothetical protein